MISNQIRKKCPLCETIYESESIIDINAIKNNLKICKVCSNNFCFICNKSIHSRIHYFDPISSCFLMEYSNLDSFYLRNTYIRYIRHFLLVLICFLLYPIFALFSSFFIYYFFGEIYIILIETNAWVKLNQKLFKDSKNLNIIIYLILKIPKIFSLIASIYLYSLCAICNIAFVILLPIFLIILTGWKCYKYIINNHEK